MRYIGSDNGLVSPETYDLLTDFGVLDVTNNQVWFNLGSMKILVTLNTTEYNDNDVK